MVLPLSAGATPAQSGNASAAFATTSSTAARTFRVYAHREGLVGHTTANGHVTQENDHFVALPCTCALSSKGGHEFEVKIEYQGRSATAPVWDVGPWNIDDNYWDPPEERKWPGIPQGVPEAAAAYTNGYNSGLDGSGRKVLSPAGIDIADGTFYDLGMTDSDWVDVTFLWMQPTTVTLPPLPGGYEDLTTVVFGQRPPLDPVAPKDSYTNFPETGHNVPRPIMDYWTRMGGWRNLGLPITELFREVRSNGTARIVQYFERGILELTPPPSDKPIVQADLIGYSSYSPPSSRAPVPAFEDNADHWYFPETQHSLNFGFKQKWINNGGSRSLRLSDHRGVLRRDTGRAALRCPGLRARAL